MNDAVNCGRFRDWALRQATGDSRQAPAEVLLHPEHCKECRQWQHGYAQRMHLLRSLPAAEVRTAEVHRFLDVAHAQVAKGGVGAHWLLRRPKWTLALAGASFAFTFAALWHTGREAAPPLPHSPALVASSGTSAPATAAPPPPSPALPPSPAAVASLSAPPSGERELQVQQTTAGVWIAQGDTLGAQPWREAKTNERLSSAASLRTDLGGGAQIDDPFGGTIEVAENTQLRFTAWTARSRVVDLASGQVTHDVHPLEPGALFEVRTPLAATRVVGTRFRVRHDPGKGTLVVCEHGVVRVTNLDGGLLRELTAGAHVYVPHPAEPSKPAALEPTVPPETVARHITRPGSIRKAETSARHPDRAAPTTLDAPKAPAKAKTSVQHPDRVEPPPLEAPPAPAEPARADASAEVRALLAQGHPERAIAWLEIYAGAGNAMTPALYALWGDAHSLAGQAEQALVKYRAALELAGPDASSTLVASVARFLTLRMSAPSEALVLWQRYLTTWPSGSARAEALAAVARNTADETQAEQAWSELLRTQPHSPEAAEALAALGGGLLQRQRFDEAIELFRSRVSAGRKTTAETALLGLARAQASAGLTAEAKETLDQWFERFPNGGRRVEAERLRRALQDR